MGDCSRLYFTKEDLGGPTIVCPTIDYDGTLILLQNSKKQITLI